MSCGDNLSKDELPEELDPVTDPLEWVDPTIGTGGIGYGYGSAFVGAAAPHGLVKLAPDTRGPFGTIAFQHYSGYFADDDTIETFSHMHLHGTGLTDYGLIGVMPTTSFDPAKTAVEEYAAKFDKSTEVATPGKYSVTLIPYLIQTELVATTHAAHHRYRVEDGSKVSLVVDLSRSLIEGEIVSASIALDPQSQTIRGRLRSEGQMTGHYGGHDLFFAARTRAPWNSFWSWADGAAQSGMTNAEGIVVGAAIEFSSGADVEMQIGISLVSPEGALANLNAELPAWDIDKTAQQTKRAWFDILSGILVEGGTRETRRTFYSALYHSFLMPTIISDVDGYYVYDGVLGQASVGNFVSDLSLWDTYRTLHPLYHLMAPDSGADAIRSLAAMGKTGSGFPRWPIAVGESGVMLGASADVVLADGIIKLPSITGIDPESIFDDLVSKATDTTLSEDERGGRSPSAEYLEFGYVPDSVSRSVSTQLEYAVDDFALSMLASFLGMDAQAKQFLDRSESYRMLFDPETKTFRPRSSEGEFPSSAEYDELDFGDEFAEANAMQMLWAPLHDIGGLQALLGGTETMVDRLDSFFSAAELDLQDHPIDDVLSNIAPRPQYWHGNEPDIHAAYLFGQLGRDDLTQHWLHWIRNELYADTPAGLAGNDDAGTLSSWYVFTAMGFYPVAGSEQYFVGMPIFPKISVRTPYGTLTIVAEGADKPNAGVSGVTVNGEPLTNASFSHDVIRDKAVIEFEVTSTPTAWSENTSL